MMCRRREDFTAERHAQSEVMSGELVSGNYFALLGIGPAIGRVFTSSDDLHMGAHPVAVLSHAYWMTRFSGNRGILGQTIRLNNYPFTIVGVSQTGFDGLEPGLPSDIFVPMAMTPAVFPTVDFAQMFDRRRRWVNAYGRLKPGMTMERAKAGLQPLFHQILTMEVREPAFRHATDYDEKQFLKMWLDVIPGSQGNTVLRRQYEKPLWVLTGVVGLVLLIACANLAGLLTARGAARQKEIAVRLAIGSSRRRIVEQLLTESLLLAGAGGAIGIAVAVLTIRGLLAFLPPNTSGYAISSSPDWRMLAFSLGLSLVTGILFGLIPALEVTCPDIADTLKGQSAGVMGGMAQMSLRKLLVGAQVALSLLLLVGASLFIRSLANLRSLDPGFHTRNLVQFALSLDAIGYDQNHARAFFKLLEQRLRSLPGVRSAGVAADAVLSGDEWSNSITVAGHASKPGEDIDAYMNAVTPGYFQTLGIHLLAGRNFSESDEATTPKVAIVNRSFAKHYFGDEAEAVGRRIGRGSDPNTPTDIEIVGVVNDAYYENLRQPPPREVFLCGTQARQFGGTVYVSTEQDPRSAFGGIRAVVHDLEPKAPVMRMKTFEQQEDESLATERMITTLSSGFSILATALAIIGLYGVMAYMVGRRAREIAIRMALGAMRGNVVWLVMREVLLVVGGGIAIALPLVLGLTRLVEAQLFSVRPNDPVSIATATLVLAIVAVLAGYIPAQRAAGYEPSSVLRYE
jgi:predicted permease